ncbi:MAG TPA: hypothetical protein DHV30_01105, partial [Balneola sp.]|nr:hypothetical protein [Balneola sp.]
MKFLKTLILLITFSIYSEDLLSQSNETLLGNWKINNVIFSYIGSEISDENARLRVGNLISITDQNLTIFNSFCRKPIFKTDTVKIQKYLYINYRSNISIEKLGISNKDKKITSIKCTDNSTSASY